MPCEHKPCDAAARSPHKYLKRCLCSRPEWPPEADGENPFLRAGNDGGEAELQKTKLWALRCHLSAHFEVLFLKEGKQRIIYVAQSASCTTNRGTETVYFQYEKDDNYRLWRPAVGFRIWSRHSKHKIDFFNTYYTVIIRKWVTKIEPCAILMIYLCPQQTTNQGVKITERRPVQCATPQQDWM